MVEQRRDGVARLLASPFMHSARPASSPAQPGSTSRIGILRASRDGGVSICKGKCSNSSCLHVEYCELSRIGCGEIQSSDTGDIRPHRQRGESKAHWCYGADAPGEAKLSADNLRICIGCRADLGRA